MSQKKAIKSHQTKRKAPRQKCAKFHTRAHAGAQTHARTRENAQNQYTRAQTYIHMGETLTFSQIPNFSIRPPMCMYPTRLFQVLKMRMTKTKKVFVVLIFFVKISKIGKIKGRRSSRKSLEAF